jgi:hypothetical protein
MPAGIDVFGYIGSFYNPRRRHSTLGYLSAIAFEQRRRLANALSGKRGTAIRTAGGSDLSAPDGQSHISGKVADTKLGQPKLHSAPLCA